MTESIPTPPLTAVASRPVLEVITMLDPGGAERHLLALVGGLRQCGRTVCIAFLKGTGTLAPQFRALGCRVEKIPFENPLHFLSALKGLQALMREMTESAGLPPLVHSHLLKANVLAGIAARRFAKKNQVGVPHVVSKHNDEPFLLKPWMCFIHRWLSDRNDDQVIGISDFVRDFYVRHKLVQEARCVRIHYGLDIEAFDREPRHSLREAFGFDPDWTLIGIVARVTEQKGHCYLIEALATLKNQFPRLGLLVVGGPGYDTRTLEAMQRLVVERGLAERVRFTGFRNDLHNILATTDILALPSLWEGFGLILLEAMAARLPIVASRVSAIPEVLDEQCARLVTPRDVAGLAAALAELASSTALRQQLGAAGRERLERQFSLSRMVAETEALYRKLESPTGA